MKSLGKYLLKAVMAIFGILPLKVHYALARFLSWLACDVVGYRRDDVMVNLSRSFPEMKYEELTRVRKDFYRHFGDLIAETVWFGASSAARVRKQRIVEIANPEVINHLADVAPSVVTMYSHCGNWELLGGIENYNYTDTPIPFRENNFCVVYKALSSKVWDDIMRDNRCAPLHDSRNFPGYIESGDIIRYAFKHRDEQKFYNMNTDQSPYFNSGANVDIEFMHQRTRTMTGAAALARKFGMAVAYLSMNCDRRGHYVLQYTTICEDASTMSAADIMKKYYELLERDINANPANYLWTHRRWKIRMDNQE